MTIFASFLLGALWAITAGFFGFGIGAKNQDAWVISGIMAVALSLATVGFVHNLPG